MGQQAPMGLAASSCSTRSRALRDLVEQTGHLAVNPRFDHLAAGEGVDLAALHGDVAIRRRDATIVTDVDTPQRPAGTDETPCAEKQILVEVQTVERFGQQGKVRPDVVERERCFQSADPSRGARGDPAQVARDIAGVERGDGATDQVFFRAPSRAALFGRGNCGHSSTLMDKRPQIKAKWLWWAP